MAPSLTVSPLSPELQLTPADFEATLDGQILQVTKVEPLRSSRILILLSADDSSRTQNKKDFETTVTRLAEITDGIWGQGEKTFWFRQEWGHYNGKRQWIPEMDAAKLVVTARRLDGPAPPPEILRANPSYRDQDWKAFLVGGINFPRPGCWEVSGHYENDELAFVVWVVKRPSH